MKKATIFLFSVLFLSSCFKEEDPRVGVANYETISIGDQYYNQVFYSLMDTSIVSINDYRDWNIEFYCGTDASYIRLNSAANMWVIKTNSTDFDAVYTDTYAETERRFDGPQGLTNNLAIDLIINQGSSTDTIFNSNMVYLIHPGVGADGADLGTYKKFMFEGIYQDSYLIRYANLDGTDAHRVLVPRDAYLNFTAFSFTTNNVVDVEPDKATWDLLFSRFTDTVYTVDGSSYLTGYAVTGTYLNQSSVEAYIEEDVSYENIKSTNIDFSKFSSNLNTIGHSWKQYSGQYYVFNNKSYVIKDRNNNYFKMRFLSFYNATTGLKGYPSFEFEAL